ncbi:MAG TPA: mandelate racemase/muconate lactonizing enzyme family protein [Candidatus Tectomicrobia bacterium]|jgi:galactonate dehydratase
MPKPTRIEHVDTMLWDRWLLVRIACEDGTVGIGEGGVHGWQRPTRTMVEVMTPYLLGKDPHRIEHHYQFLYRSSHFMGAVVQGALSAIDLALWDIKGKRLGVPIYDLLGGKTRHSVRCYIHIRGNTCDALVQDATAKVKQGFTAVRFSPWAPDFYLHRSSAEWAEEAVRRVGAVRETVGPDVDLCVEIHRQMHPAESIALGRRLEQFHPFFYEDPMRPDSPARMGDVQEHCNVPIATGERFTTIFEFQQLLEHKGCAYIRPDLCLCGGLTGCKKVAALAEAQHVQVIPHNPLSPVSTAACVQLDACIPNFALQEYTGESEPPKSELLQQPLRLVEGYLVVPEGPGLGIALNEVAIKQYPPVDKVLDTPLGYDGSVQDR